MYENNRFGWQKLLINNVPHIGENLPTSALAARNAAAEKIGVAPLPPSRPPEFGPSGGGAGNAGGAAAGAGGGGGGSGCASAGFGGLLSIIGAGVLGGFGLGGIFDSVNAALAPLNSALSAVGGIGTIAQAGIAMATGGGPIAALSIIGAGISPALGGVLPAAMAIASGNINIGNVLQVGGTLLGGGLGQDMVILGGIAGLVQAVAGSMVGKGTNQNVSNFINNMYAAQASSALSRSLVAGTADSMATYFGNGPNGLGASILNNDNLVTYGASSLSNNLPLLGSDLIKAGKWDSRNQVRMMKPANILAQIISEGYGDDRTKIIDAVLAQDIPIGILDGAIYDDIAQKILNEILDPDVIKLITDHWQVQIKLDNLGQLTNMQYMLPNAYSTMTVKNWTEFGLKLIDIQITDSPTLVELGILLGGLERVMDLNNVAQMTTPFHKPSADLIMKTYGYGSGTFGELTMADFIGTAVGYVHEDTFPVLIDGIKFLETKAISKQYFDGTNFLLHLSQGKYTTQSDSGGSGEGGGGGGGGGTGTITYTYTVPYNEPGYTNGFLGTFSDSQDYTSTSTGTKTDSGLTAAITAIAGYIEAGMLAMKNSGDADVVRTIEAMDKAHAASIAQILRESHLLRTYDIDLFLESKNTPLNAISFAYSVGNFADQTGYGQFAHYLEKAASSDIYGDAIKATMRMVRNAKQMEAFGVNTDRFNLPMSQYYRDPLQNTKSLYDGLIPPTSAYNAPIRYTTDKVQQYVLNRDTALADAGYTQPMDPLKKDIIYADLYWQDVPASVRQQLGLSAVKAAINRNVFLLGDKLSIVDINGMRIDIATIKDGKIVDLDTNVFIAAMFDIVNKILYGNIFVDTNSNPFLTDQIIYAVAEWLGNVNSVNVLAALNEYLGQSVLARLIDKLAAKFGISSSVFDTSLERNKYIYGGAGPEIDPSY